MKAIPKVAKNGQQNVIPFLKTLLADESALYLKTLGINFFPLDLTCNYQLHKIDRGMDKIAEHLRGYRVLEAPRLNIVPWLSPDVRASVRELILEHLAIIRLLRENISQIDEGSEDIGAVDLMISLLLQHQKMVKVLRLSL